ncbi:class I SAM-dependent methyltransferase [Candidatus Parcubacteria bacterium]|nr:MAG: class I SAM-dependent methyltransferase [Candidatus Parcubacteria bacterium]
MKNNSLQQHWEEIYRTKNTAREVSWYQDNPQISIDLIQSTGADKNASIIDIGGGDSKLVDALLDLGFQSLFVLDISAESLKKARTRFGDKANSITWVVADVLDFETDRKFDIWHDRAALHFLTEKKDISRYVEKAYRYTKPNGYLIIAAFSINGPKKCSGLDITQYSETSIKEIFNGFEHIRSFEKIHTTPSNMKQNFLWSILKKLK